MAGDGVDKYVFSVVYFAGDVVERKVKSVGVFTVFVIFNQVIGGGGNPGKCIGVDEDMQGIDKNDLEGYVG